MRKLPVLMERAVVESSVSKAAIATQREREVLSEGTPSCAKGCTNCCYHPVYLNVLEALSLYLWLSEHNLWSRDLRIKLEAAHEKTWGLSNEVWALSLIPCPLLENNACKVYEARPLSCRITYSMGDPYDCHPHRLSATSLLPKRVQLSKAATEDVKRARRAVLPMMPLPLSTGLLAVEEFCKDEGSSLSDIWLHFVSEGSWPKN